MLGKRLSWSSKPGWPGSSDRACILNGGWPRFENGIHGGAPFSVSFGRHSGAAKHAKEKKEGSQAIVGLRMTTGAREAEASLSNHR